MPSASVERIAAQLLTYVSDDAIYDLRFGDPGKAIERHFPPLKTKALPRTSFVGDACSTDGWYEVNLDPDRPWIFYSRDQNDRRVRFTVAHELGHTFFSRLVRLCLTTWTNWEPRLRISTPSRSLCATSSLVLS